MKQPNRLGSKAPKSKVSKPVAATPDSKIKAIAVKMLKAADNKKNHLN